jgi:hypothetical protein
LLRAVKESLEDIGGLDLLKDWLLKRRYAFSRRAIDCRLTTRFCSVASRCSGRRAGGFVVRFAGFAGGGDIDRQHILATGTFRGIIGLAGALTGCFARA